MLRNSSINLLRVGFRLRVCSTGNLTYHTVTAWSKGDDGSACNIVIERASMRTTEVKKTDSIKADKDVEHVEFRTPLMGV